MANQLFEKFKFLLNSTNEHGVHSPFVFDYLTKCVYRRKNHRKSKSMDVLLKSISYFGYKKLQIEENSNVRDLVNREFENLVLAKQTVDLIYIETPNLNLFSRMMSEEKIHNNSMILINNIYKNKTTIDLWNEIISSEKVTVTIDFFYCGIIFFRKEQVKEHFKIRI